MADILPARTILTGQVSTKLWADPSVAATLQVHRQTVGYRMTRLRELYGSALEDPDTRARMMLALAWGKPTTAPGPSNGTDHPDALRDRP